MLNEVKQRFLNHEERSCAERSEACFCEERSDSIIIFSGLVERSDRLFFVMLLWERSDPYIFSLGFVE